MSARSQCWMLSWPTPGSWSSATEERTERVQPPESLSIQAGRAPLACHCPAASGHAWSAPLPQPSLRPPALLCGPGWSLLEPLSAQQPAWAPLSLLSSCSGGRVLAVGAWGEPRALQRPQPGSDRVADHGAHRGRACGQSGLEAGSPVSAHFPLCIQGPGLGAVCIGPAFQEVRQHLTLALDADLPAAHEAVSAPSQQPVNVLGHLQRRKASERPRVQQGRIQGAGLPRGLPPPLPATCPQHQRAPGALARDLGKPRKAVLSGGRAQGARQAGQGTETQRQARVGTPGCPRHQPEAWTGRSRTAKPAR